MDMYGIISKRKEHDDDDDYDNEKEKENVRQIVSADMKNELT